MAFRAISIAEAAGVACLIGTTQELSIGTAAAAHVEPELNVDRAVAH